MKKLFLNENKLYPMNKLFRHKAKAFTIVELIVTMVLASIIVGMAYGFFTLFQKHIHSVTENENTMLEKLRFHQVLENDFLQAQTVNLDLDLELNSPGQHISYQFYDDYTIRLSRSFSDTFRVVIDLVELSSIHDVAELPDKMVVTFDDLSPEIHSFTLQKDYEARLIFNHRND